MQKINWYKFKVKNEDYRKAFEELSYFLFCRKFKRNAGIFRHKNQIGIETEPIQENRKLIGFQAKYFDSKIKGENIIDSITKAKEKNPKLNKIIFYINQEFSESTKKGKKDSELKENIESHSKQQKVHIEWVVPSNFELILTQPSNLDLAQLYFDFSDEFGFVSAFSDPKILTFLQSSEYVELPFLNSKAEKLEDIATKIFKENQKGFLITGHPGSGKSISIYKLFQVFSGLDKNNLNEIHKVLEKNKAVPMLINLKNCTFETIENVIRNRQSDYKLRHSKLGYIYLLDGLDELSPEKADHVLSYLYELEKDQNTKKIIISCRSGNLNKINTKTYFNNIAEYRIDNLTQAHLDKYFTGKNIALKSELLSELKLKNLKLIEEAKDILLVKLLWDTIEELNEDSTILDLLDKKIKLLIKEPAYRKNIEELNLLNPKENKIIELNQEISFYFQNKFQSRLSQKEIQKIILAKYPRADYKSANVILNYIATLFLDGYQSESPDESDSTTFAYQHKRYQDFFFIQHLRKMYEKNPKVLRELNVLSNRDFFENLFLNYVRNEYKREKNLPGVIELNLMDVYLGNRNDFGVENPYYQDSSEFMTSLAIQDDIVLHELLAHESLQIIEKISIDLIELKSKFEEWNIDKGNWRLSNYLKGIWSDGISFLLENIIIFWSFNKQEVANELIKNYQKIEELFEKYNFRENLNEKEKRTLESPFWKRWQDWLYLKIVIYKEKPNKVFNDSIRENYNKFSTKKEYSFTEEEKERLVKSFFRVCIDNELKILPKIIDDLSDEEFLMLIETFVTYKNIPLLLKDTTLSQKIKSKIEKLKTKNIWLLFLKKLFNLKILKEEKKFIEETIESLLKQRRIDWQINKTNLDFAIAAYVLDRHSFKDFLKPQKGHPFKYYNEIGLYAALFRDYIELLRINKKIEAITRDYIRYIIFYTEGNYDKKYFNREMSLLWAHIFTNSNTEPQKLINIKRRLVVEENNIIPFIFSFKLQELNQDLFVKLVNKSELQDFENQLHSWDDDFPSYVDRCFDLSLFYAHIDKQKAISYIAKGINEGMVRHGWRKDAIVSYLLVDALEILWENNWATKNELTEYTKSVFKLALRVSEITDGAETIEGPYNVIDLASKYDIELAVELKNYLKNKKGRNFSNSAISSILIGKINLGLPIEDIENEMKEYKKVYRYDNEPVPDYYEEKFKIYLTIAQSDFYTKDERKKAFESAYGQIKEIKKEEIDYFLTDIDFKDLKNDFVKLCKKYNKEVNISFDEKEHTISNTKISKQNFIKEIKQAKTKHKINSLYRKLSDFNNNIVLTKSQSWKILIEKTFEINKNIKPFIDLLRKNSFPHTDFMTSNSKYFHFGLAVALKDINTKEEMLNYLFDKTTGHGGFLNVMKSYEVNGNKEMCLKLFSRYLRFCDFLVN